jgi:predicted ABC-type ATPase
VRDPVLHLVVGPNGAGKSLLCERVIEPTTHLPFVNADVIAARRWPDDPERNAYEAARLAAEERDGLIASRCSFIAETVFSHESKLDLVRSARSAGYLVTLHVVMVSEALAVARVALRVEHGGHAVPEEKIRGRYQRLWPLVADAIGIVDDVTVYDNSAAARPYRVVARFERGALVEAPTWPAWAPEELRSLDER